MSRMDRYNDEGWRCPSCGRFNKTGARFCTGCGSPNTAGSQGGYMEYGNYDSYGSEGSTYVAEPPKKKGGAVKVIAITLICLLAAGGIGFGVYKIIESRQDKKVAEEKPADTETGQTDDGEATGDTDTDDDSSQGNTYTEPEDEGYYVVGNTYTVVEKEGVKVRSGPGRNYDQLNRSDLSDEYYYQSDDKGSKACLKKGAVVECLEMNGNWMRITDGWVCVEFDGDVLIE